MKGARPPRLALARRRELRAVARKRERANRIAARRQQSSPAGISGCRPKLDAAVAADRRQVRSIRRKGGLPDSIRVTAKGAPQGFGRQIPEPESSVLESRRQRAIVRRKDNRLGHLGVVTQLAHLRARG